jgi:hypothetical protein
METKITNLKKLSAVLLTTSFAFSGVALAGDAAFMAADVNTDGKLDRDEFLVFVSVKADNGDTALAAVRDTGEYDTAFAQMDVDADGKLSHAEAVPASIEEKPAVEEPKWEEPELKKENNGS